MDALLGLTVPFNVAEVDVTIVAEPVVAAGAVTEIITGEVQLEPSYSTKAISPSYWPITIFVPSELISPLLPFEKIEAGACQAPPENSINCVIIQRKIQKIVKKDLTRFFCKSAK